MKLFVRRSAKTTGTLTPDALAYLEAHKAGFREHMKQAMACRPPHKQGFSRRQGGAEPMNVADALEVRRRG